MIDFKKVITVPNIFFFLLLLFATAIRVHPVFAKTFAFTYDVGRDMLNLSQIVYAHKIPLIGPTTGLPGLFYGPWWYYILVPAFFLSSGNPQGIVLFMALVGIATVICSYVLGVYLEGKTLGLFLAGLVAFSSATISLSVQIWNPNIAQLFVALVLLLLVFVKKKKRSLFLYFILGLLLGLVIDSEVVFGLLFFAGIAVASVLLLRKEFSKKGILFMVLGILIIFSPRIVFELKHQFVITTHIFQLLANAPKDTSPVSFVSIVVQRLRVFWETWNWSFGNMLPLSIVALMSVIFQTIIFVQRRTQTLSAFIIKTIAIVTGVFFVGLLFFKHDIFSHYLVALPVYFLVISGICMYFLLKNSLNKQSLFLIIAIFLLVLLRPIGVYTDFFGKPWVGDASVYKNQLKVVDYVYKEAAGKPFKYVTYTPAVIDYPYQYLFAWYGPKTYAYAPSNTAALSFFILEPNTQFPNLRLSWLAQRQSDGKIVKEKVLPGDITVQTRVQ